MKPSRTTTNASLRFTGSVLTVAVIGTVLWVNAGELTPPAGPIAPTMKDLDTVEPRTPIRNLPGGVTPIVISQSGSYYLAEDIQGLPAQHGIEVTAPNVTLDLRGFTISGNTEVLSLKGISLGNNADGAKIRNGTIQLFGGTGISSSGALNVMVESVSVISNGLSGTGSGIWLPGYNRIKDCQALNNIQTGIRVGTASVVSGTIAAGNGLTGIFADSASVITECTAYNNGSSGISAITGSIVTACTAYNNAAKGIWLTVSGTVRGCNARENGEEGILVPGGLIHGSTSTSNVGVNHSGGTLAHNHG